jgi:hypothetical protein
MSKPSESAGKLTQREYAAIHLAVPESGTEWLDDLIKKSPHCKTPATKKPVSKKETSN